MRTQRQQRLHKLHLSQAQRVHKIMSSSRQVARPDWVSNCPGKAQHSHSLASWCRTTNCLIIFLATLTTAASLGKQLNKQLKPTIPCKRDSCMALLLYWGMVPVSRVLIHNLEGLLAAPHHCAQRLVLCRASAKAGCGEIAKVLALLGATGQSVLHACATKWWTSCLSWPKSSKILPFACC